MTHLILAYFLVEWNQSTEEIILTQYDQFYRLDERDKNPLDLS